VTCYSQSLLFRFGSELGSLLLVAFLVLRPFLAFLGVADYNGLNPIVGVADHDGLNPAHLKVASLAI
jgi:hypothetical protein